MAAKILDKLSLWCTRIASVIIGIVCLIVVASIIGRIFNKPIKGTVEIVSYGVLIAMCLSLSRTGFLGKHVHVTMFVDMMPKAVKAIIEFFQMIIAAVVFGIVIYLCVHYIPDTMASGLKTDVYRIPQVFVYVFLIFGMFLSCVTFIFHGIVRLMPLFKKQETQFEDKEDTI